MNRDRRSETKWKKATTLIVIGVLGAACGCDRSAPSEHAVAPVAGISTDPSPARSASPAAPVATAPAPEASTPAQAASTPAQAASTPAQAASTPPRPSAPPTTSTPPATSAPPATSTPAAPPAPPSNATPATPPPSASDEGQASSGVRVFTERYPNGQVLAQYQMQRGKDGKYHRNGFFRQYYGNGKLEREGVYRDEVRIGIWKMYREDGSFDREVNFGEGRARSHRSPGTGGGNKSDESAPAPSDSAKPSEPGKPPASTTPPATPPSQP